MNPSSISSNANNRASQNYSNTADIEVHNGSNSSPVAPEKSSSFTIERDEKIQALSSSSRHNLTIKNISKFEKDFRLSSSITEIENTFFKQDLHIPVENPCPNTTGVSNLQTTQHLRRCLQSVKINEEKQQLMELAFKLPVVFNKTSGELSDVKELIQLSLIADLDLYRELISVVVQKCLLPIDNLPATWGLGILIKNCPVRLLIGPEKICDLARVLRIFQAPLKELIQQEQYEGELLSVVLQTISHLLDAMFLVGINQIDYAEVQKPLDGLLEKVCKQKENPALAWQARYARYALAHLPSDEGRWSHLLHHFSEESVPIAILLAFEMYLIGTLAIPFFHFCKHHFHAFTHLAANIVLTIPYELSHRRNSASPQSWYVALRFVDIFIEAGNLVLLEKFARHSGEAKNKDFLLGLCRRLTQLALAHPTQTEVKRGAIEFLRSLTEDHTQWGNHQEVQDAAKAALGNVGDPLTILQKIVNLVLNPPIKKQTTLPEPSHTTSVINKELHWNVNLESPATENTLLVIARHELLSQPNPNDFKDIKSNIDAVSKNYFTRLDKTPSIQNALEQYVDLQETRISEDGLQRYPLDQTVKDFLANPNKHVLLLLGEAGSGKTLFCHHLAQQLWKAYSLGETSPCPEEPQNSNQGPKEPRIPLLIDLSTSGFEAGNLLTEWLHKQKFSASHVKSLRKEQPILLILDGYDKFADQNSKFYGSAQLKKWKNTKIIITARAGEVSRRYDYLFCPDNQSDSLQIAEIAPFSDQDVDSYIGRYAVYERFTNRITSSYREALEHIPGLNAQKHHPFSLKMALDFLPALDEDAFFFEQAALSSRTNKPLVEIECYDQFIQAWLSDTNVHLSNNDRRSLASQKDAHFDKDLINFSQNLAIALHERNEWVASYSPTPHEEPSCLEQLLNNNEKAQLWLLSAPLFKENNTYRFIHPLLQQYLISRALCGPAFEFRKPAAAAKFNQLPLMNHSRILSFLVERAKKQPAFTKYLRDWIEVSKEASFPIKHGASNAITILIQAGEIITQDLRSVSIPFANLKHGFFDRTRFDNANLTGVNFSGAWLRGAQFNQAKMKQVQFGNTPAIFSATGKNFIDKIELSSDGHWLASYGPNAMLILHSLTGNFHAVQIEAVDKEAEVIFSPNNQWAAWQDKDGAIFYRNLTTSTAENKKIPFKGNLKAPCVFSLDSQYLIVPEITIHGHDISEELKVLADAMAEIDKYNEQQESIAGKILSLGVSTEMQYLVEDGLTLKLKQLTRKQDNLKNKENKKYSEIEIQFFSVNSNEVKSEFIKKIKTKSEITAIAFSSDREYLFICQKDLINPETITIEEWPIQTQGPAESIYPRLHFNKKETSADKISSVSKMLPSPDGRWLALARIGENGKECTKVSLHSLSTFKTEYSIKIASTGLFKMSFSPNGQWLAIAQGKDLIVLPASSEDLQKNREFQKNILPTFIHALSWQPNADLHAIGGDDKPQCLLTIARDNVLRTWQIVTTPQNAFKLELIKSAPQIAPRFTDISIAGATELSADNAALLRPFCIQEVPLSDQAPNIPALC